jgi:hypothetical protein
MASVAFDTLKAAQRLEAAGFPTKQAQDMASAIADTTVVTPAYLNLRLSELRLELANVKADILKWVLGAIGFQTLAVIGGLAALFKLLGH